ncbi:MAG: hypothetical protein ACYS9X_11095 [Planctomycetota bacterium]
MTGPRTRDLVFLPGQLLAVAVPFLPFTQGKVPIGILLTPGFDFNWPAVPLLLLAPALLGSGMVTSTVRQALAGRLSRVERACAYVFAFAALTAVALACVTPTLGPVFGPTAVLTAFGAIAILASTRKGRLRPHLHAHVALLAAWIMSMGFAVIVTFAESHRLGPGWWAGAVSVVAVTVEAVVRVRRALRSEGEAEAEAPPS